MARPLPHAWLALALCAGSSAVSAQDAGVEVPRAAPARSLAARSDAGVTSSSEPPTPTSLLEEELSLLSQQRLAPASATSVDELSTVLEDAHERSLRGRKDEAVMLLLEAVEGPRFRSFEAFDTFAAADLMLGSLLLDQHALLSAQRSIDRLLARGVTSPTFGPAYRRAVDIALARGDHAESAEALKQKVEGTLPSDASDELHYLLGLAARDRNDVSAAQQVLAMVGKRSRFYAHAQYLLGAMAAARHAYEEADARFCAVRQIARGAPRTRFESQALYASEDLARLGMGRVAHEQGRGAAAFDHYFQVPNDSPLIAEALFESAYASYEQGHPQTALDSLKQLEARYPHSAYTAEARVLRGYVHLARCDFERAEQELLRFESTFGAVLGELTQTLESPTSTQSLFEEQAASDGKRNARPGSLLLGLLKRDPQVTRLRRELAALDAELARSSRTSEAFSTLAQRVRGKQAPLARAAEELDEPARIAMLRAQASALHAAINAFSRELTVLRAAGAKASELAPLQQTVRKLFKRSDAADATLREQLRARATSATTPRGQALGERLEQEADYVEAVRSRALRVRDELESALAQAERDVLEVLRARIEKELRRAQIGRIDAVMGKKRKLELEVESLSAGRFPPELASHKQVPALLSDDQEYWPFEGEDWADEYVESPSRARARKDAPR